MLLFLIIIPILGALSLILLEKDNTIKTTSLIISVLNFILSIII